MADTQSLLQDLVNTVKQQNQPLAAGQQSLTSEFFSDPAAVRARMVSENAANPLDPLAIDKITGARMGQIGGQLSNLQSMQGATSDLLGNYFNALAGYAQNANQLAAQQAAANKKSYELKLTDKGYQTYDPETGQLGPVIGQAEGGLNPADVEAYAQGLKSGSIAFNNIPDVYKAASLARYQQLGGGSSNGLVSFLQGLPLIGGWFK